MPRTILQVAAPFTTVGPQAAGEAEQRLARLDRAVVAAGHQSLVIGCGGSKTAGTLLPVPDLGVTATGGPPTPEVKAAAWANHRRAIARALCQWPVDLIHLHGADFPEYLLSSFPKFTPAGVPVAVTLHLPLAGYRPEGLLPCAGVHFCCVSERQRCAAPPGSAPMRVIPDGMELPASPPRSKRRYVMMLGPVSPEKGMHLGIEAARRAGFPLLLAALVEKATPCHERYFEEEINPRLGRRFRFAGPLDSAARQRLLGSARCLLAPSLVQETGPLAAMEALACGTPVVAFASGVYLEWIEPGRTGFLVHTPAEMAHAIRQAGRLDPAVCRETARERFSAETTASRYLRWYEEILEAGCPWNR